MKDEKDLINLISKYEKIVLELEKWSPGLQISELVEEEVGEVESIEKRDIAIKMSLKFIKDLEEKKNESDGKLYLSEIVSLEKPEFTNNNLILSPVGSGKTYFMKTLLKQDDDVLLLVSTTSLKNKFVPVERKRRKQIANRMYSTKNKDIHGENSYKILVMTYAEFGERIKYSDSFAQKFTKIFCDEIHSLPLYQGYNDSPTLLVVMHYLFRKHENQPKYYFTATSEYLDNLKKESYESMQNVTTFNYLNHPKIKRYMPLSSYKIHGVEQVRPHLKARRESFEYFGHKIFAFCKTIDSQLRLKQICEEEGFTAQAYWSTNNDDKKMTEEQIAEAQEMINNERLPDKYDVVIINSALQEGWDLKDERVKLAIMNTVNETEFTQALGRIRKNVDVLVYKVGPQEEVDFYVDFPSELLGKPLDTDKREELRKEFDLRDRQGRLLSWRMIAKSLEKQGFIVSSKQMTLNGSRKRVSIIHSKY